MSTTSLPRIAVLLSGRGSNFEAIARNVVTGKLECEIGLVFANNPDAQGLAIAQAFGLRTASLSSRGKDRTQFDNEVMQTLKQHRIEFVCLAGYMRLLTPAFVQRFRNRILNIHPSLLPAFPGMNAQAQALAYGVKTAGCTVHLVDEGLDSGAIVMQAAVPVEDRDTVDSLSARILQEEHRIYSQAIALVVSGQYRIEGRRFLRTQDLDDSRL